VDSAAFTQQLVQYSQVEQQIETNDQLKSLLTQNATSNGAAAVAYIGKDAVLDSDVTRLEGGAASWSYDVTGSSGPVTLSVRDSTGKEVYKTNVAAASGGQTFAWDGKDATGRALSEGSYRLVISAKDSSGETITPAINVVERITGIDFSGDEPNLITPTGRRPFDSILTIKS
jgi:flagellar basal-body rod modification protein FlgD